MEEKYLFKDLSYKIVGVAYEAFNQLGCGYQEKYYQKAMAKLFTDRNIKFIQQVPYEIKINDKVIGRYYLDFLVEKDIVVEIKKGNYFLRGNIAQVKGYLAASELKLAILINFTSSCVKFLRIVNIK